MLNIKCLSDLFSLIPSNNFITPSSEIEGSSIVKYFMLLFISSNLPSSTIAPVLMDVLANIIYIMLLLPRNRSSIFVFILSPWNRLIKPPS